MFMTDLGLWIIVYLGLGIMYLCTLGIIETYIIFRDYPEELAARAERAVGFNRITGVKVNIFVLVVLWPYGLTKGFFERLSMIRLYAESELEDNEE